MNLKVADSGARELVQLNIWRYALFLNAREAITGGLLKEVQAASSAHHVLLMQIGSAKL